MPREFSNLITPTISFSKALIALKKKKRLARIGWNGRNMYIYMSNNTLNYHKDEQEYIDNKSTFIVMKTTDDKLVPWFASQTDIITEDWIIL